MENDFEYVVKHSDELIRIDKFISNIAKELSRSLIQKLLSEGHILVNGSVVKSSYKVKKNDLIEIDKIDVFDYTIVPKEMSLDIVYEDDDLLVVNKPSGLVVHPAPGHYDDTLINGLMFYINSLSDINGELRPGIVHRIDKDTSGLLMVAKTNYAHNILADELKHKKTKREYIALVEGVIKNKRGKINAPIARDTKNRLKMAVLSRGKTAVTHFEVLETFKDMTLIKCILETGRTHQIRVHMSYIGHPLVGDYIYGNAKNNEFGQFLHAKTLGFTHPRTNEYMEFDSELPLEFKEKLNELRKK